MTKRKQRPINDLYHVTQQVPEPEMTPVFKGNCRIEGPTEEKKTTTNSSRLGKRVGGHFATVKDSMRAESGTCNVCAAPCSMCRHMEVMDGNEFSDEVSRVNAASRCSSEDAGGMTTLKKRECLDRNSAGSETSNLVSASSSHDSISENAESKASLKNFDTIEDVEMLPKVSLGELVGHDQDLSKARGVINQSVPHEEPNVCNGADVSCVSGANDSQTPSRDVNMGVDKKNQLCRTASLSNFVPEGLEKKCNNSKAVISKLENNKSSLITSSLSGSSMKDKSRLEAGTVVDTVQPPTKSLKQLESNERIEKSSVSPKVPNNQDPPSKSQHDDVSNESEIVEDDVKVCDICGDAGREDLLAICSRCSDGAEHTYCMRIMMDKVPEGDWLCEVCQLKEAAEKQKDECEPFFGNAKASCIIEKSEKYVSTFDSKNDPKSDTRSLEEEVNETTKAVLSPRLSLKRRFDNLDVSLVAKRRAIESNVGSPKPSSPNKTKTLSRESSFKNVDKVKVKPKHPLHSLGVSSSQDMGNHAATSLQNSSKIHWQFQSPRGSLSKSSSFNTSSLKPKVKMVHEDVPQKNKLGRHLSTTGSKKGLVKEITRSSSFQIGSSHSNSVDIKAKTQSPKFTRAEDLRGSKLGKERNTIERKNSFRSDCLVSPKAGSNVSSPKAEQNVSSRGETMTLSSGTKFRDLKPVQADVRLSASSKSSNLHAHRGSEAPNTSGGRDFKRRSSLAPRSIAYQSFDGNSTEPKSFEVVAKDENVENLSCTADGPGSNFDFITQDGLPPFRESIIQDKRGEEPSFRQSSQSIPAVAKSIHCLKCKEIGHAVQFCLNGSIHVSVLEGSSREVIERSTNFKDANEAAFMKNSGICKNSGLPIQSDELSSDGADERKSFKNSTTDFNRSTTVSYVKHDTVPIGEAGPSKAVDLDDIVSSEGKQLRPCLSDLQTEGSSVFVSSRVFFIPEQEYIWKGGFEVQRSGQVEFYDGMQAHLSTCASPKVIEAVNKLPHKLLLEEVSRSSTWPTQFQNCVTEDNIAFYFFANDVESYLRSYQSLVENMMKNDLALKGVLDGIELLIFPSNQLCEKSKRWNMLYFLWGVFRGRRLGISQKIDASMNSLLGAKLNEVSLEEELPSPVTGGTPNEFSSGTRDYDMPTFGTSLEHGYPGSKEIELGQFIQEERENVCIAKGKTVLLDDSNCIQAGVSSTSRQRQGDCPGSFTHYVDESSSFPRDAKTEVSRMEMTIQEVINNHSGFEVTQRDTLKDEKGLVDADFMLENETMRSDLVDNEQGIWVVKSCHKRPYSTLLDKVPQASDEPSACTSQLNSWKAKSDGIPSDGENNFKKLKKVHGEIYSSDSSRRDNSLTEWQLSQRLGGAYDGTVMPASLVTTERYFFPIESGPIRYVGTSGNSIPVQVISSDDEDQLESDRPNLDLALGGEKKSPKKRMEPLYEVNAERKKDHGKCPESVTDNEEDDALGSLSLSLAAPFPGKMVQRVKPAAKQEPESSHIDTSLILFGGFPGT